MKTTSHQQDVREPYPATRLREKILDDRQMVTIHVIEKIVAVQAHVVHHAARDKAHPDTDVDDPVARRGGVTIPEPRLARRQPPLQHPGIGIVLRLA